MKAQPVQLLLYVDLLNRQCQLEQGLKRKELRITPPPLNFQTTLNKLL